MGLESAANPWLEEPDAENLHVRICEGPGVGNPPGLLGDTSTVRPGKAGRKGVDHAVIHEISSSRPVGAKPTRSKPSPAGR